MKNTRKSKKGFTLIELIVVIAILGILAAILIPQFSGFTDRAKQTQALTDAKQFATAMDGLRAEKGNGSAAFTQANVEAMAFGGDTPKSVISGFSEVTGAFTATYTEGSKSFAAGRKGYNQPVELT